MSCHTGKFATRLAVNRADIEAHPEDFRCSCGVLLDAPGTVSRARVYAPVPFHLPPPSVEPLVSDLARAVAEVVPSLDDVLAERYGSVAQAERERWKR